MVFGLLETMPIQHDSKPPRSSRFSKVLSTLAKQRCRPKERNRSLQTFQMD